jgi:hypothetical protein
MLGADNETHLQDMITGDDASVGMAHAYLVSPDDLTITHADSALASFVGSDDAITDPQNCLRVAGNAVCVQMHVVSDKQGAISVLVSPSLSDILALRRRREDGITLGGLAKATLGGAVKGAITGVVFDGVGAVPGAVIGGVGSAVGYLYDKSVSVQRWKLFG